MPKDQIEIALEPEAASLYCRSMKAIRTEQGGAAAGSGLTKFPKGTRYMVLDCGGTCIIIL